MATMHEILENKISIRNKYANRDFRWSQWLKWIALVGSIAASACAITQVNKKDPDEKLKLATAILGFIPLAISIINKEVNFAKRSTWNEYYKIDLEELLDELDNKKEVKIRRKYRALQRKKEKEWVTLKL